MKMKAIEITSIFKAIKVLFFAVFLLISFLIIVVSPQLVYISKKQFLFSNVVLLLIDILTLFVLFILYKKFCKRLFTFIEKYSNICILIGSIFVFLCQIYLSYNYYFLAGWDAGLVFTAAKEIVSGEAYLGEALQQYNYYFSVYPNNITLAWIYSKILMLNDKFGIFNAGDGLMAIVAVNCIISSITGVLTYKCVENLTNKKWAFFSWVIYLLLVGLSPWVVITYSDPLGLFFPILTFFLYSSKLFGKNKFVKWILFGVTGFVGYYIKPQIIIILIAIIVIEMCEFVINSKRKINYSILGAMALAFLLASFFHTAAFIDTRIHKIPELKLGWSHFVMMGLNDENDGAFNANDLIYSVKTNSTSERRDKNIAVIKERLNKFGILGYLEFLTRKALVNYGDGTFAWGSEGEFYQKIYDDRKTPISQLIKSYYYDYGDNYNKTSTLEQAIWILVIISMLGLIFSQKEVLNREIVVLMLSILGLTAFVLIFEARARYLYTYTPIYICLCSLGLKNFVQEFSTAIYQHL